MLAGKLCTIREGAGRGYAINIPGGVLQVGDSVVVTVARIDRRERQALARRKSVDGGRAAVQARDGQVGAALQSRIDCPRC